jgi:hypothetical protein
MPRSLIRRLAIAPVLALGLSACFHQVVQTGTSPSTTVVDKPFVSTWIFGLVPAPEIDVRQECPTGVAIIETEQSFINGLVSIVTFGIYTPQHVRITCASRTALLPSGVRNIQIPATATAAASAAIARDAAELAIETNSTVVLHF